MTATHFQGLCAAVRVQQLQMKVGGLPSMPVTHRPLGNGQPICWFWRAPARRGVLGRQVMWLAATTHVSSLPTLCGDADGMQG